MAKTLTIRMYDVGHGDCFLITIPVKNERARKILVDCGSMRQGVHKFKEVVLRLIEDLKVGEPDQTARVDVVIASHAHKDHIVGFGYDEWDTVEVGEVWMPWVESPDDVEGIKLRASQERLADALANAPGVAGHFTGWAATAILNAARNADALARLREGFKGNPARGYLAAEEPLEEAWESESLPGVELYVLGPPRSKEAIKDMDPPSTESFLRARAEALGDMGGASPFGPEWHWDAERYWAARATALTAVFPDVVGYDLIDKLRHEFTRTIQKAVDASDEPDMTLAAWLENALNNTSLILLLKIGKATLLLPGDAQWGPWDRIFQNEAVRGLLQKTTFYKLGHHGSHNANSRTLIDQVLPAKLHAMVSVKEGTYNGVPKDTLLANLIDVREAALVRSDKADEGPLPTNFTRDPEGWFVELKIPM